MLDIETSRKNVYIYDLHFVFYGRHMLRRSRFLEKIHNSLDIVFKVEFVYAKVIFSGQTFP